MKKFLLFFLFLVFVFLSIFFLAEERNHVEDNKAEDSKGYVTFWFDDGLLSTYETAFPVLRDKEWQAVLAVVSDYEKAKEELSYDGDFPMDMEKVLEIASYGWEISSHSKTHSHLNSIYDEYVLEREIAGSKKELEDIGLKISSFTFPYGEQGRSLGQNIISREYFYWRSSTELVNEIPAWRHITSMFMTIETTEQEIAEWIREAEQGGWLVIGFHGILSDPKDYWQQTPEQFMMVVEMIEESDLEVVLPKEIFEKHGYAEGHYPKIDSDYKDKIIESDFEKYSFKIVIPEIAVDADLRLASSFEDGEIDFGALDDYPVLISDKASYFLSPLGDYGVSLIIGHRNLDFRRLDQLKQGDEIFIANNNELNLNYEVSNIIEIKPEEIWKEIEKAHQDSLYQGKSKLILMTCTPYGTDWKRLLIFSEIVW